MSKFKQFRAEVCGWLLDYSAHPSDGPVVMSSQLTCASIADAISEIAERHFFPPADDDEPLTEEWANSLSRKQSSGDSWIWVLGLGDVGRTVTLLHQDDEHGDFWALYMAGVKLQMMVTRGDVRRGCAFLGIPSPQEATDGGE